MTIQYLTLAGVALCLITIGFGFLSVLIRLGNIENAVTNEVHETKSTEEDVEIFIIDENK